jgi:hypothetical protein
MSRKTILAVGIALLLLAASAIGVMAQGGEEFEEVHIVTTASRVVGIGSYVAAEAYGFPGTPASEGNEAVPATAIIFPYGIYPNLLIEHIEDFVQPEPLTADLTFAWALEVPDGSAAELIEGNVAIFMADVEGEYLLTLTATDAEGLVGETTWSVLATTYVGSGYLDGPEDAEDQCVDCHDDVVEAWAGTGHSDMLIRGLNGTLSDHYGPNCISCHTTGFNNRPEAVNGGFDDLALEAGWTWPEELAEGGWDAFVEAYPEVAGMANIQCESCHGPGYLHVFEGSRRDSMISRELDYGVCAQCHAEDPYHVFPQQWEVGTHGDKVSRAFEYPTGEGHEDCVRCHSGAGYIDYIAGEPAEDQRLDALPIECASCHDPHSAENPYQLRSYGSVVLPEGEFTGMGPAATCMNCHNVRRDGGALGQVEFAMAGEGLETPHHGNVQAELMLEMGGYTWDVADMPTSPHGRIIEGSCTGCHMAATPGNDADGNPLPGRHTVGEHTFRMTSAVDGTANVAACQECHDGTTSFDFEARRDYDGDGAFETNLEEIAGLREMIWPLLFENGLIEADNRAGFEMPEEVSENLAGATWNYFFTEPAGVAVHNLRYSVALLQLTYEKLAGEAVPGAYIIE